MSKLLAIMALAASFAASAQEVSVQRNDNGSGVPGNAGVENAETVYNDIRHSPQYMPNYPTAATIWPRVVEVPCVKGPKGELACSGYKWSPSLGRGEYLFVVPKVVEAPKPQVVEKIVTVPVTVIKEVPVKKGKE